MTVTTRDYVLGFCFLFFLHCMTQSRAKIQKTTCGFIYNIYIHHFYIASHCYGVLFCSEEMHGCVLGSPKVHPLYGCCTSFLLSVLGSWSLVCILRHFLYSLTGESFLLDRLELNRLALRPGAARCRQTAAPLLQRSMRGASSDEEAEQLLKKEG